MAISTALETTNDPSFKVGNSSILTELSWCYNAYFAMAGEYISDVGRRGKRRLWSSLAFLPQNDVVAHYR